MTVQPPLPLVPAAIGAETGVSTATVRVALGRRRGSIGWEGRNAAAKSQIVVDAESACASRAAGEVESAVAANQFADDADERKTASMLAVLADPVPRAGERALARYGLLTEAEPVFTQGARLPLAGLWLVLPALAVTGLLELPRTVNREPSQGAPLDGRRVAQHIESAQAVDGPGGPPWSPRLWTTRRPRPLCGRRIDPLSDQIMARSEPTGSMSSELSADA